MLCTQYEPGQFHAFKHIGFVIEMEPDDHGRDLMYVIDMLRDNGIEISNWNQDDSIERTE